jgi:hypothetical protein
MVVRNVGGGIVAAVVPCEKGHLQLAMCPRRSPTRAVDCCGVLTQRHHPRQLGCLWSSHDVHSDCRTQTLNTHMCKLHRTSSSTHSAMAHIRSHKTSMAQCGHVYSRGGDVGFCRAEEGGLSVWCLVLVVATHHKVRGAQTQFLSCIARAVGVRCACACST